MGSVGLGELKIHFAVGQDDAVFDGGFLHVVGGYHWLVHKNLSCRAVRFQFGLIICRDNFGIKGIACPCERTFDRLAARCASE